MMKLIKEYIDIVILVIALIIGALFLGYKFYQRYQWWESLSPEEQQRITLTNERNYSYDYVDGVIIDTDDMYYWAGTPHYKTEAEIYCAEMNETFDYEGDVQGVFNKPVLWNHENGEHVKCERVTVTNGYGDVVRQYLSNDIELYED